MARRTAEGKTKTEIIRCLKRHIAREVYGLLVPRNPSAPTCPRRSGNRSLTFLDSYRSIGKVQRFNRTLLDEWAYLRPYASNTERTDALADFLHTYNHHRCHTALEGQPPISRVNNAAGQYT